MSARGSWLLILFFSLLYGFCISSYVQGGDTAELVLAARHKLLAHPPGYPLWIWLQHFWISLLPAGTTFFKASLLNVIFATLTFSALVFWIRGTFLRSVLVLLLGFGTAFFESAILPDVFMLHALFVGMIGALYLFAPAGAAYRYCGIPLLFGLGLTNHLTLIVMIPAVLHAGWQSYKNGAAKKFTLGAAGGLILLFGFYSSLLLLDGSHPMSWKELHGFSDLFRHFLRSEYGTFSLTTHKSEFSLNALYDLFSRSLLWYLPVLIVAAIMVPKAVWRKTELWIWTTSLLIAVALFAAFRIQPEGIGAEVLLRFHVMPAVQLVLLIGFLYSCLPADRQVPAGLLIAAIPLVLNGLSKIPGHLSLRNDSIIEDYAVNLLKVAQSRQPALIFVDNDSAYFGLRYVQAELLPPGVQVATAVYSLFFNEHYLGKLQKQLPDLKLANAERIWQERKMKLKEDLLQPNVDSLSVFVTKGFQSGAEFKVTFYPLGRLLSPGMGLEFDPTIAPEFRMLKRLDSRPVGPQAETRGYLYAQYSHYFLAKAAMALDKTEEAIDNWSRALEVVPFAYPALMNLCSVAASQADRCAPENLKAVQTAGKGYF